MKNLFTCLVLSALLLSDFHVQAQSTFADVVTIMRSKCDSDDCHGSGAENDAFNVDTTTSVLYSQLLNNSPTNPFADSLGFSLVRPGVAQVSFLLLKIAHCNQGSLKLQEPYMGARMPEDEPKLSDADIELIYQWVMQGADSVAVISPDTVAGEVCDIYASIRTLPAHQVSFHVFPNPASEEFAISYELTKPAQVSVEAFDSKGAKSVLLSAGNKAAGTHRDDFISELAQGVYFIRLTIDGDHQYMQKLVVR